MSGSTKLSAILVGSRHRHSTTVFWISWEVSEREDQFRVRIVRRFSGSGTSRPQVPGALEVQSIILRTWYAMERYRN